jgi:hypothetical protein
VDAVIQDDDTEEMEAGLEPVDPSNPWGESPEALKARRQRSLALALGLVVFVIIVFIVTIVKLKGNVLAGSHL